LSLFSIYNSFTFPSQIFTLDSFLNFSAWFYPYADFPSPSPPVERRSIAIQTDPIPEVPLPVPTAITINGERFEFYNPEADEPASPRSDTTVQSLNVDRIIRQNPYRTPPPLPDYLLNWAAPSAQDLDQATADAWATPTQQPVAEEESSEDRARRLLAETRQIQSDAFFEDGEDLFLYLTSISALPVASSSASASV
jgi:hypothetical protein